MPRFLVTLVSIVTLVSPAAAEDIKRTELYRRIRAGLDAVPAIDTHDHLRPFEEIPFRDVTDRGKGMTPDLAGQLLPVDQSAVALARGTAVGRQVVQGGHVKVSGTEKP